MARKKRDYYSTYQKKEFGDELDIEPSTPTKTHFNQEEQPTEELVMARVANPLPPTVEEHISGEQTQLRVQALINISFGSERPEELLSGVRHYKGDIFYASRVIIDELGEGRAVKIVDGG
jgi:hypothetical protein